MGRVLLASIVAVGLSACGDADDETLQGRDQTSVLSTTAPTDPGAEGAASPDREALAATRAAVEAWGRFTDTGDLAHVRPFFHEEGPQFPRLREGAAGLAADPDAPTSLRVETADVVPSQGTEVQRVVRATVVLSRPSRPHEQLRWEILLFRAPDGAWKIWAVRDTTTGIGPVPADPSKVQGSPGGSTPGYR